MEGELAVGITVELPQDSPNWNWFVHKIMHQIDYSGAIGSKDDVPCCWSHGGIILYISQDNRNEGSRRFFSEKLTIAARTVSNRAGFRALCFSSTNSVEGGGRKT
jgi:hypothetical protein